MHRSSPFAILPLFAALLLACSSSSSSDSGDGGHCCPPDPHPGCCMNYGGWSGTGNAAGCFQTCDGMPFSNDPAWKLVTDEHGCQVWSSAGSTGPLCFYGYPDSGHDTGHDAAPDTDADAPSDTTPDVAEDVDAPACPTTQPLPHDACASIGQICYYGCGVVVRCTETGWDYDTTIDGGPPCP